MNLDLQKFFEKRGLPMVEMDNGKIFPASLRSADVLSVLLGECMKRGVDITYGHAVREISLSNSRFIVSTDHDTYSAAYAVVATGGISYPATGSSGDGYRFAENLGHKIMPLSPALTPVYIKGWRFGACSGISLSEAEINLYREGRSIVRAKGDVLFTHKGLSGPGILDMSRNLRPGDIIKISLISSSFRCMGNDVDIEEKFIHQLRGHGSKSLKNCMAEIGLPVTLAETLLECLSISGRIKGASVDKGTRRIILNSLLGHPFEVERAGGFNEAMATRGGISLENINRKTMESRLVPGLYFAGEVMDVDGDTGGYNLQHAFSSAALAGRSISVSMSKRKSPQSKL